MPEPRTSIVLDSVMAERTGLFASPGVVVLPCPRRGVLGVDAVADAVAEAPATAVVLVRPPWADAATAPLAGVAILLGHEVVWLPSGAAEAAWATALIARWAIDTEPADLVRRAQVAVGLAAMPACRLPRRPWGCERAQMPALRAVALARWCDRLWAPCEHCTSGGGAPGGACGRCGHAAVTA